MSAFLDSDAVVSGGGVDFIVVNRGVDAVAPTAAAAAAVEAGTGGDSAAVAAAPATAAAA